MRIESVLPDALRQRMQQTPFYAPGFVVPASSMGWFGPLHEAVDGRRKALLSYLDVSKQASRRTVRPLGLSFWGTSWSLTAWCEARDDFRNFRLDRIQDLRLLDETFTDEPGKTMEDFLRLMDSEERTESKG